MLRALLVAIVGTLVVACLLTPLVYAGFESILDEVPWPYSRVFDRVVLVVFVVWLVRLRATLALGRLAPFARELATASGLRKLALGALVAFGSALAALPFVVAGGMLDWHPNRTVGELVWKGVSLIPAAILIGVIEEALFRLILFERPRARIGTAVAAGASSLLYAAAHFVSPDKDYAFPGWSPTVGFEYLGAMAAKFASPGVPAGIVGLTLVGLTLCLTLVRTRSFALCVGLHAGWILAAKLAMKIARRAPGIEFPTGAGRRNFLVTQPAAWVAILLVAAGVLWLSRRGSPAGPTAPAEG